MYRRRGTFVSLFALAVYHQQLLVNNLVGLEFGSSPDLLSSYIGQQLSSFIPQSEYQYHASPGKAKGTDAVFAPSSTTIVPQNSPWAYAFLLGGARLEKEGSDYQAGLFSVVTAAHSLRSYGSKADIVLMVQLSVHAPAGARTLERWQEELLEKLRIRIVYLPHFSKPVMECFYSLVMEKFRILTFTEYSRVMFMDYDIFPKCNLDYIFELSDPKHGNENRSKHAVMGSVNATIFHSATNARTGPLSPLMENVVLGYKSEPSNAGLFVLKPNADDYQLLLEVIRKKEEHAMTLPYPHWDEEFGWGHRIASNDRWKSNVGVSGTNWTWPYAYADQGLLYYWTKYVKKTVSLVRNNDVENWSADDETGNVRLESTATGLLNHYSPCHKGGSRPCPYSDFVHFTGPSKPWKVHRSAVEQAISKKPADQWKESDLWYYHLRQALNDVEDVVQYVNFDFIGGSDKAPSVGRASSLDQMARYLRAKKRNQWNQYMLPGGDEPIDSFEVAPSTGSF